MDVHALPLESVRYGGIPDAQIPTAINLAPMGTDWVSVTTSVEPVPDTLPSTVVAGAQVAGLPVVGVPTYPVSHAQPYEPAVLVQVALAPQMPLVAHSFTSVQVAGEAKVVTPEYPLAHEQVYEIVVLVHVAFAPQFAEAQ
jgi:hypothetical protein